MNGVRQLPRLLVLALALVPACASGSSDEQGCRIGFSCKTNYHGDSVLCTCVPDADAGIDASEPGDAAPDALPDATDSGADATDSRGIDVNTEQDAEAGPACPAVETYCAADAGTHGDVRCVLTWSAAMMPASFCASGNRVFLYPNCHGHDILVDGGVDTSVVYYYDATTSMLVGIERRGLVPPENRCVAISGAPITSVDFSECTDGRAPSSICEAPADAGRD
jgi:hypothetical protein